MTSMSLAHVCSTATRPSRRRRRALPRLTGSSCRVHIIRSKSAEFDPSMLEDHYRNALVRILRKKEAKRPAHHAAPVKPSRENVVNLMDALRRSIAAEHPAKAAPRRGLRKSAGPKRPARARTVR